MSNTAASWHDLFVRLIPLAPTYYVFFKDGDRYWLGIDSMGQIGPKGLMQTARTYDEIDFVQIPSKWGTGSTTVEHDLDAILDALRDLNLIRKERAGNVVTLKAE